MSLMMESTPKDNSVINEMLFKLERNHAEIQTLLGKLNSYTCEPTNYECFERLRDLRDNIESLKKRHLLLFSELDSKQLNNQSELVKKMRNQIAAFKELDQKIGAYLIDTNGY
jgi:predicted nuclease with TOPRIM domain